MYKKYYKSLIPKIIFKTTYQLLKFLKFLNYHIQFSSNHIIINCILNLLIFCIFVVIIFSILSRLIYFIISNYLTKYLKICLTVANLIFYPFFTTIETKFIFTFTSHMITSIWFFNPSSTISTLFKLFLSI